MSDFQLGAAKVALSANKEKLKKDLTDAKSKLTSWTTSAKTLLKGVKTVAGKVFSALTKVSAVVATLASYGSFKWTKSILEAGSAIEQWRTQFKVLAGDMEVANDLMADLMEFSEATPFEPEPIVESGKALLAFGFAAKDIKGLLADAGNLAAGMGKEIDMVANAFGRIRSGDFGEAMEVLRRLGISKDALKAAGLDFEGKAYEGSWEAFLEATRKVINDRFAGMMEEMARTSAGLVSTLKGKWTIFKQTIAEAGFLDAVNEKLTAILDLINQWQSEGKLKDWAKTISDYMTRTLNGVTAIIEKITGLDLSGKAEKDFIQWDLRPGVAPKIDSSKYIGDEPQVIVAKAMGFSEEEIQDMADFWRDRLTDAFLESAEGAKVISDAMRVEAVLAADEAKKAFDMLHEEGGEDAIPPWAQAIINAIDRIKTEFANLKNIFSEEGWAGVSEEITSKLTVALKGVNWGDVFNSMLDYKEEMTAIGKEVGTAIASGIRQAFEKEAPGLARALKLYDLYKDFMSYVPGTAGFNTDVANSFSAGTTKVVKNIMGVKEDID